MSATKQLEDAVFYAAASVVDAGQRRIFLDQACANNPGLRAVVEGMLSTQGEAERFFDKGRSALHLPADEFPAVVTDGIKGKTAIDEQIGTRVDRYKLLQRIGEGGCGVVYMAEQEEPVRRRVALKVIKLGMDTKSVVARFEAERQALALMDHPNIARVLDAGATETGRPYFVMELVRGIRITDYCDQSNLDTNQRLHLFIQICHAIQHAHHKGVIHRDIKPSNILVTLHDGVPVPKVIDFGIAKAIEGKLTDQTLFTAYEQFIGTPAYMSPEQAEMSGMDVDTRSDIYSLGVLLYELLTGRTPFDSKQLMKSGLEEMRRTLRDKEPQRPSTILTTLHGTELKATAVHRHEEPPRLISLLKGDLDWIVMKALEKDRARRYETANGLATDIERYLNNEPVVARPPSRRYRFQKLVRRNKVVFAAGAAVTATLVIGLGASTYLFFRDRDAHQEQARLRETAEKAEKRENELRQQTEAREKINLAAVFVSQEKYEQAAKLLDEVKTPPPKPSLDGVSAYRSVGEWLALQDRWKEAAERYSALMEIDKLDKWGAVTLDYQACGVVLVESGELDRYGDFCRTTIDNFATTTNGDAAGRILKTCLLMPADENLIGRLQPLGQSAEKYFSSLDAKTLPSWATIPVSVWKYRCGDYDKAAQWCRGLNDKDKTSAMVATLRLVLAMSSYQSGQVDEARSQLALGREAIETRFQNGLELGNHVQGFWYDWVFARILLREATTLIEGTT
jgi:serine/threonine protein kinase/predicted negative regulator of RcsB-dependent stress response